MRPVILTLAAALIFYSIPAVRAYPNVPQSVVEFGDINLLVPKKKGVEQPAVQLRLEADTLIIEARKSGDVLKQFQYSTIKSAEYSHSKHPRWKEGVGAAAVGTTAVGVALGVSMIGALGFIAPFVAVPLFLKTARMKGKKHWLTIKTESDYAVLRLDKSNYRLLIPALETRAAIKVETVAEKE